MVGAARRAAVPSFHNSRSSSFPSCTWERPLFPEKLYFAHDSFLRLARSHRLVQPNLVPKMHLGTPLDPREISFRAYIPPFSSPCEIVPVAAAVKWRLSPLRAKRSAFPLQSSAPKPAFHPHLKSSMSLLSKFRLCSRPEFRQSRKILLMSSKMAPLPFTRLSSAGPCIARVVPELPRPRLRLRLVSTLRPLREANRGSRPAHVHATLPSPPVGVANPGRPSRK